AKDTTTPTANKAVANPAAAVRSSAKPARQRGESAESSASSATGASSSGTQSATGAPANQSQPARSAVGKPMAMPALPAASAAAWSSGTTEPGTASSAHGAPVRTRLITSGANRTAL